MDQQDVRYTQDPGNGSHVADEVEVEIAIKGRVDRTGRVDQLQCIAIGRRPDDVLCRDVRSGTWLVFYDEGLPEPLRKPLAYEARRDVHAATRRIASNDAHRARRIGLGRCDTRYRRQRGSTHGRSEKGSAGKFYIDHILLPNSGIKIAPRPTSKS